MYKDKEGREYRLDQKTAAALDALYDAFEGAERGFGPRDTSAAEPLDLAALREATAAVIAAFKDSK